MPNTKTFIISGATGTIGKSITLSLAKAGANLILIAKNKDRLTQLGKHLIKRYQHDPLLCPIDFLSFQAADATALFAEIKGYTNAIDGLIHCAGIAPPLTPLSELSTKDYLNTLQINAHAKFYLSQQAIPLLKKSSNGKLIFCEPTLSAHKAFHALEQMVLAMTKAYVATLNEELTQSALSATLLQLPPINSPYRQKGYPFEEKDKNASARDFVDVWESFLEEKALKVREELNA